MGEILTKSFGMIFMICLAYFLKKRGVFKADDSKIIATLILTVNLPCVVISGFKEFAMTTSLVVALLAGFLFNVVCITVGYLISVRKSKENKLLYMMTAGGYNVGIFTIPFVASFLPPSAMLATLMFDMGNAPMVFGGLSATTSVVVNKEKTNPMPILLKKLSKSVSLISYICLFIIYTLGFTLPSQVFVVTDIAAGATGYLAMIMVGLMVEVKIPIDELKAVSGCIVTRYACSALFAVGVFYSPLPYDIRKALMICAFAPLSTSSMVLGQEIGCKPVHMGIVGSVTIMVSIVCMLGIVIFV